MNTVLFVIVVSPSLTQFSVPHLFTLRCWPVRGRAELRNHRAIAKKQGKTGKQNLTKILLSDLNKSEHNQDHTHTLTERNLDFEVETK